MTKELFIQAILKFTLGAVAVGLLVFVLAGTVDFWQGWLFMGILFIPMFLAGFIVAGLNYCYSWQCLRF